mgnify:CR=1 FL=1
MLKTRIIPCLDVADGRVVKGVNFVGLRDAGDPVESAKAYDAAGADELCFLDIMATEENRGTMFDMVRRTAEQCYIPLTVGGGVRSTQDVRALLLAGADKVSFNAAAVANPDVVAEAADAEGDGAGPRREPGEAVAVVASEEDRPEAGERRAALRDEGEAEVAHGVGRRAVGDAGSAVAGVELRLGPERLAARRVEPDDEVLVLNSDDVARAGDGDGAAGREVEDRHVRL